MNSSIRFLAVGALTLGNPACSATDDASPPDLYSGGSASGAAGSLGMGGKATVGGSRNTGGVKSTGGSKATGGRVSTGGRRTRVT